jgi:AcrR family transcriptional regulator
MMATSMPWFIVLRSIPLSYGYVTYLSVATVTRMRAEARREQLLDATKALVAEAGFHAVSIEAVARQAGITRPIVYRHFDDLPALLEALVERETVRALGQLRQFVPRELGGDPREDLLASLSGYLQAVESDPVTWRLMLVPPEGAPGLLGERIAAGRAAVIGQLAGAIASPDPELTARALSAVADEAARLLLADPQRYPSQRVLGHAHWLLFSASRQTDLGVP